LICSEISEYSIIMLGYFFVADILFFTKFTAITVFTKFTTITENQIVCSLS